MQGAQPFYKRFDCSTGEVKQYLKVMGSHRYVVGGETICFTRRDVVAGPLSKYTYVENM